MSFTRTFKRKNKDGTVRTYYAEVESVRVGDKVIQRYVRPLGTDPEHPKNIPLESVHFSYLALRLMQDALTPNDLFEMLEKMGQPVKKEELEKIGINYDFIKKTYSISLFYKKISKSRTTTDVQNAKNTQ
ncbi:MAG: hypothetical protein ACNA7I_01740 [Candidatus Methanoperedens sp.]|nr:hypothetical protein [Candidatus Methanoperedens sp.]